MTNAPVAPHDIVHDRRPATVDEWGRDERLVRAVTPLAALRWDVTITGGEHVGHGAALLVVNSRRLALTPVFTAWAIGGELGRPVRFVGRPDIVPFGPVLRRLGGLIEDPAEVRTSLREGDLVVVAASRTSQGRRAGVVPPAFVAVALEQRAAVHPVAAASTPFGRAARVEIEPPVRPTGLRRGPLAAVELAEAAQHRIQAMLDRPGAAS